MPHCTSSINREQIDTLIKSQIKIAKNLISIRWKTHFQDPFTSKIQFSTFYSLKKKELFECQAPKQFRFNSELFPSCVGARHPHNSHTTFSLFLPLHLHELFDGGGFGFAALFVDDGCVKVWDDDFRTIIETGLYNCLDVI